MKYRKVDPKIWNDEKFNSLSDAGKLVFFFLLTHPHMTPVGAMRGTMSGFAEELGWKTKAFREAFAEALSKGMVKANPKAHFVSLPNFIRYNSPESPNVVTAWGKCMDDIPECPEKNQLYYDLKALLEGYAKGFREAFAKAFAKPTLKAMPNQEQEQEQEQEQDITPPNPPQGGNGKKRFIPPSVEEVSEYCMERKNKVDPELFVDFYQGKGWMVGKNKMKDWKAAVRTWEKDKHGDGENGYREFLERHGQADTLV